MIKDAQEALDMFAATVLDLLEEEGLAYANPAERAIVGRLAVLLEGRFFGWDISVEWNRREDMIKRLHYGLTDEDLERAGAIIPDLLIHRIGKAENLLVVEIKKVTNKDYAGDIWKLEGMTIKDGAYAYAAGLHLILDMPGRSVVCCDVYIDGAIDENLTSRLRGMLP